MSTGQLDYNQQFLLHVLQCTGRGITALQLMDMQIRTAEPITWKSTLIKYGTWGRQDFNDVVDRRGKVFSIGVPATVPHHRTLVVTATLESEGALELAGQVAVAVADRIADAPESNEQIVASVSCNGYDALQCSHTFWKAIFHAFSVSFQY